MDRQTLIRDMKTYVGGGAFITSTQVARYMRLSTDRMPEMLKELEHYRTGRAKQYFIPDVASRIQDRMQID
jgi:hypothetical protein